MAAGALVPLVMVSSVVASGSVKRLYIAYLFAHGQSPSDDLTLAHVDVLPEFAAWGIVLAAIILAALLIRYLLRSRRQTG